MLELINKFRDNAQECKKKANERRDDRLRIPHGLNSQFSCDRDKWCSLVRQECEYITQASVYEECANELADLFASGVANV